MSHRFTTAEVTEIFTDFAKMQGLQFYQIFDIDPIKYRCMFTQPNNICELSVGFCIDIVDITPEFMDRIFNFVINAFKKEDKL